MVVLFFLVLGGWLITLLQSLKSSNEMQVYKVQQQLLEEKRQAVIQTRAVYENQVTQLQQQLVILRVQDSVIAAHAGELQNKINQISTPVYVQQKIAPINSYGDAELQQYFNNLQQPVQPNDY